MFLHEHWTEIAQIDGSIVAISPFRVDVPSSSQRVGFSAQLTRMEADNEVELRKILRPMGLSAGKNFCGGKLFEILVVRDHVSGRTGTF